MATDLSRFKHKIVTMKKNNLHQDKNFSVDHHIFLLSHMRASTSLMSHILGSHPEINGYYEMHLSYRTDDDLEKQKQLYSSKEIVKNSSKYLFDKLLHNDYDLLLEHLAQEKIKVLVSIRDPERTIKSIINLFRNKETDHPYADPEEATQYYIDRVTELASFCEHYKQSYYYYDADLIRTMPNETLKRIQNWLSLAITLTEQYQLFSLTGQPRLGDTSENIKKGRIVKHQTNYKEIEIPCHSLEKAEAETHKHKQFIVAHAIDSIIL